MTTILIIIAVLLYFLVGAFVATMTPTDHSWMLMVLWLPCIVIWAVLDTVSFFIDLLWG